MSPATIEALDAAAVNNLQLNSAREYLGARLLRMYVESLAEVLEIEEEALLSGLRND
jgi:hypothetical protein